MGKPYEGAYSWFTRTYFSLSTPTCCFTRLIDICICRFALFLSQERNARMAAKKNSGKKHPINQSAALTIPSTQSAAPELKLRTLPPLKRIPSSVVAKEDPEKLKTAIDESYEERAYVTFPYYPSLTFFDNPFETTHSGQGSPHVEPVYSTYSYPQPESDSSRRMRGLSSLSQSRTSRSSSYSDYDGSDPGSLIYYDNTHQKVHTYSSQPNSSTRYKDYFNIFS